MLKYVFAAILIGLIWAIVIVLQLPQWIAVAGTAAIVGVLVGLFFLRRYRALRAARDIERALSAQADEQMRQVRPEQQAEIQAMQGEFNRAIASLKTSKLGKVGADALYALPWYMIVGPPGSGKSTALRNSGLQFPYLSQAGGGVRGVGGTRNCEWWLTNEGVILDTAGRYTTEEDDKDEWLSFLDMLKKFRPRKPVNGIMVAISVGDLGGAHEEEVATLAKRIRERVDEVMGRLQMIVPVYLLFTKCDLIPGFVEMFGDLRKQERGQIWGFTVPLGQRVSAPAELFTERFEELSGIIEKRALKRVGQERKVELREKIYEFPQQFDVLKNNLADFVGGLFAENVYQGTPTLRGVYFTSGTQEGRPIDRVMSAMSEAFGIRGRALTQGGQQPVVEAKSYFLRDVFANVVFPDQDVAARSAEEIRRERNRRYAIAGGAFAFAVLISVIPAYAYIRNQEMVKSSRTIADAVAAHRALPGAQAIPINQLEPLRERVGELHDYETNRPPVFMRFGMYQGATLYPAMRDLYTSTLRRDVLDPIVRRDQTDMDEFGRRYEALDTRPTSEEHEHYYNQLKTHLLISTPKGQGEPLLGEDQRRYLTGQVVDRWSRQLNVPADQARTRQQMASNADFYLQLLANDPRLNFARNDGTVRRVRAALTRIPETSLALEQIIAEVERDGYGLTMVSIIGSTVTAMRNSQHVRGAFTRRGWEERVRDRLTATLDEITGEAWVLGRDVNRTAAVRREEQLRQIRSQYFAQYIEEWRQFVEGVRLDQPADAAQALGMLQELTRGSPPPYGNLMRQVSYNAHLEDPAPPPTAGVAATVRQVAQAGIAARIRRGLGVGGAAIGGAAGSAMNRALSGAPGSGDQLFERDDVETSFQGFYSFGAPPPPPPAPAGGGPAPPAPPANLGLNLYQEQLEFVRDALVTFNENPRTGSAPLLTALQGARTRVEALISSQEVGWRPRFRALLWPPIDWATQRSTHAMGEATGNRWCSSVVVPYERTLRSRYPFDPNGHDAALADVADFFRPETGTLWTFYGTDLRGDVPHVGDHYEFAQRLGSLANEVYMPELLRFLDRAQDIATVLFPVGQRDPIVQLEVRLRPSPEIANITFTVDGQEVEYHNGPEQWTQVRWPGEGRIRGASIRVRGANGVDETIEQDGEWGLYRLLEAGVVRGDPTARIFSVVWTLRDQNLEIGIDVRPARSENPFLGVPRRDSQANALFQPFRAEGVTAPRAIARGARECETSGSAGAPGAAPAGGSGHRHRHRHRHHGDSADGSSIAPMPVLERSSRDVEA